MAEGPPLRSRAPDTRVEPGAGQDALLGAGGRRAQRTLSPLTRISPLSVPMRSMRMRPQAARGATSMRRTVEKAGPATPAEARLRFRMPASWASVHSWRHSLYLEAWHSGPDPVHVRPGHQVGDAVAAPHLVPGRRAAAAGAVVIAMDQGVPVVEGHAPGLPDGAVAEEVLPPHALVHLVLHVAVEVEVPGARASMRLQA